MRVMDHAQSMGSLDDNRVGPTNESRVEIDESSMHRK